MGKSKVVGVMVDGELTFHAAGAVSDYDTLCGIDANDPRVGHGGQVEVKRGQKITCTECRTIWNNVIRMRLRASNFIV